MATSLSHEDKQETGMSGKVLVIAALVIIVLVAIAGVATLRRPAVEVGGAPDSYAPNLSIANIELAEATNGAGGKVTYVDGTLKNGGPKTLRSATAQVTFQTEDGSAPQTQTVPITLVRTREPYVDLEPISTEPVPPGGSHAFRLIFESVAPGWDQKQPAIRIVRTGVE